MLFVSVLFTTAVPTFSSILNLVCVGFVLLGLKAYPWLVSFPDPTLCELGLGTQATLLQLLTEQHYSHRLYNTVG